MMQRKLIVGLVALLLLALPLLTTSSPLSAAPHEDNPLHEQMEHLQDTFRGLYRGLLRDPQPEKQAEYLQQVQAMEKLIVEAKVMTPKSIAGLPAEQQPAMQEAYRRSMIKLLTTMLKLEEALLDQNYELAKELAGQLNDQKREGHQQFRVD